MIVKWLYFNDYGGDGLKLLVKSDWNGFFGLFTNNLTNTLVMASLLTVVVGLPSDMVFGKIIPAVGFSIFLSATYYSWMAIKLAKKEGRVDVTALPAGTSVPHMFLIVFMIIGPVYWSTGNAYLAWTAGLVWALFEVLIELVGSLIGPYVRKHIPRAAMLGTLAGVSLTYIALNPSFNSFQVPYIGLVAFAIILLGFVGKVRMPFGIPVGLVAIVFGVAIGWITGLMSPSGVIDSIKNVSFGIPMPSIQRLSNGFSTALPYIFSAIPLGIYNFLETIDNCESAAVAGDHYSTREAMLADGTTSIIGSLFGSPFPTAIFIGHPGWKASGARMGYSFLNGLAILLIAFTGLISLLLEVIPVESILPILIYIGIVISSQAFSSVDAKYYPAVVVAISPWLADWTRNAVDIALGQAGVSAVEVGYESLKMAGLNYSGMLSLGSGSILVGMLLGTLTVYIIDHKFFHASMVSLFSAVLAFFGIIHSSQVGLNVNLEMTISYLMVMSIRLFFTLNHKSKGENDNEKLSS